MKTKCEGEKTRRVYAFEETLFHNTPHTKLCRMKTLRRVAARVWAIHGKGKKMPQIVAGRGFPQGGRLLSYCQGTRIVLARNQREKITLIHELIHAMGFGYHNHAFVNKYLTVLEQVVNIPREQLKFTAIVQHQVMC